MPQTTTREREVRNLLLAWGGIPHAHSGSDAWEEFCCEAARVLACELERRGLADLGDGEPSRQQREELLAWADETAAWLLCGENTWRRHAAQRLVTALDLGDRGPWLAGVDTPRVDAAADALATPLLREVARAAGRAQVAAFAACLRAYCFGGTAERDLILDPYA